MDTLYTLRDRLRRAQAEAKRARKHQQRGSFTLVEEIALTALFDAERQVNRMIDHGGQDQKGEGPMATERKLVREVFSTVPELPKK